MHACEETIQGQRKKTNHLDAVEGTEVQEYWLFTPGQLESLPTQWGTQSDLTLVMRVISSYLDANQKNTSSKGIKLF